MADNAQPAERPKSSWINLVIDFGPLLVFFLTYSHLAPPKGYY
jgi:intracellular septation protein